MSHSLGGPRPCLRRILQVGVKQPAFTLFQIGVEVKRIALIVRRPSHRLEYPVDVLAEAVRDACPHRIQYEVDTAAPRMLGGRHEITIPRNHNDLINDTSLSN